jgi:hypothetical protein
MTGAAYFWLFVTAYGAQHVPVVVLTLIICTTRHNLDGPSSESKAILAAVRPPPARSVR